MKKNTSLIIVAVVALAVGYLLGAHVGTGDGSMTKGDINAVNSYKQLLTSPEYMSFNKDFATNEESVNQTITTLQIIERRIADFSTLAAMMNTMAANEPEVADCVEQFLINAKKGQKAMEQTMSALQSAFQVKVGEKCDTKKALKNAEAAFAYLDSQMAVGKQYVQTVDQYLRDKEVKEHIVTATLRDLVVSHCAVNATLTQNDNEVDYWSNISGLVKAEDMAFSLE